MAKGFAIHNALTTHGGRIPSTQQRSSQMGNLFVRADDGHYCPQCQCWSTVIKSHDHIIFDGKSVAYADDLLTCGAKILPQQSHVIGDSQGSNYNNSANSSNFIAKSLMLYAGQYQLVNELSNQPYSKVKYVVTYADGRIIEGMTDENGMTEKLESTERAENIEITLFEGDPW